MSIFSRRRKTKTAFSDHATLDALSKSQAMIEFNLDGTIITANVNFLTAMGYELADIQGKHHSIFVEPYYAKSADYQEFWDRLRRGEFNAAEYKRIGKDDKEVWIQASYSPVLHAAGHPIKVVKVATDITVQKLVNADHAGQQEAISKSQAVIEFDLTGTILTANENFCATMGYRLEEIRGQHHRIFAPPDLAASHEYRDFWGSLGRGEYKTAEYLRLGKGGKEVWLQASYNPIFDMNGRPYKVVKYATDITARKAAVATIGAELAKLAEGDFTARIETPLVGELDEVRLAFNDTVGKFSGIVSQLRDTSSILKTATGEILSGANDLADRTTRQAAALEETSAAMDQLSTTVQVNAKRGEAASTNSLAVTEAASSTGAVMNEANQAMERISLASTKISNIISLIDDIALQTNLLALNASVEAARAGDAGKGFAVVAVEVRRLAQSAASASSDVKVLIEQSAKEVASGSRLVSTAKAKLDDMVESVRQNSQLITEIARATQEQSIAIVEVSTSVCDMDEITQHNAALVEEMNAAIQQTETQARELDEIVEVFTINDRAGALGTASSSAAKPASRANNDVRSSQAKASSAVKIYAVNGTSAARED